MMKRGSAIVVVAGALVGAVLGLPLLIGIWLPDVITAKEHTLAEQRLANGHSFRVIQYWNRGDFYNMELQHTSPDGAVADFVLDADDNKRWKVSLAVDEKFKTANVILGDGRVKRVNW